jgi:hypothetical protein
MVRMAGRLTLKAVNEELARRGHNVRLERAEGYFYFWTGEAADWLDRTVRVPTLGSLTVEQWIEEFLRLKNVNPEITRAAKSSATGRHK